jgi:hypothetical protein
MMKFHSTSPQSRYDITGIDVAEMVHTMWRKRKGFMNGKVIAPITALSDSVEFFAPDHYKNEARARVSGAGGDAKPTTSNKTKQSNPSPKKKNDRDAL